MSTRVPFGIIAQRVDVVKLLAFAYLAQIAGLILLASASNALLLLSGVGIFALGSSSFGPLSASITLTVSPKEKRGVFIGKFYTAIGVAMVTGPLLTGLFTKYTASYRELFVYLLIFPISGLLVLLYNPPKNTVLSILKMEKMEFKKSIICIIKERNIFIVYLITMSFFITNGVFETLFPIYAKSSLGLMTATIGFLYAIRGGFNAFIRTPSGALSDVIGRRNTLTFALTLSGIALLLMAIAKDLFWLILAMLLYGVAWGMRVPSSSATLGDTLPIDIIPIAMAMLWSNSDIGSMIGAVLAGFVGQKYLWQTIIVSLALLMTASALITFKEFKE